MSTTTTHNDLPLHTHKRFRRTTANRVFAVVHSCAILALLYRHALSLLHSTSLTSFLITLTFLISDSILAFMYSTTQSSRMTPIYRKEFPENLKRVVKESDFPALDVFICTADSFKEPPMNVVNTALSVMAYDYPTDKVSVYVSDDGGSALTLFAFMEAAKFASHWLPFCKENNIVERCPEAYFETDHSRLPEADKIKIMYQGMKVMVNNVIERGKVGDEYITGERERLAFRKWTDGFTRQDHPTIIQLRVSAAMTNAPIVLTLDCDMFSNDPQTSHRVLCYFLDPKIQSELGYVQFPQRFRGINKSDIYASENRQLFEIHPRGMDGVLGPHYEGTGCFFLKKNFLWRPFKVFTTRKPPTWPKQCGGQAHSETRGSRIGTPCCSLQLRTKLQLGIKGTLFLFERGIGVRYGSLVEDYFTGYRLQCEGWKTILCNPDKPAFYGDSPITLIDVLNQTKRWVNGLLEVCLSKYSPITFGIKSMGPLMGLAYCQCAFWPIWSIPITTYAFLPQLALLNGLTIFPKVSEPWFLLYVFVFLGAYDEDLLDFYSTGVTFQKWWSDQRMWLINGLSSFLFGATEFFFKSFGIATLGFNVTSKVLDEDQSKRYEQGSMEFGVPSPLFVPLTTAAIVNLAAFAWGHVEVFRGRNGLEGLLMQMFIAGFGIVNCIPIYEGIIRSDKGKIPTKITLVSTFLAFALYAAAYVTLRN
ncbi:hypothetical protein ACE6H2_017503 [Prunus campanulata]